MSSFPNIPDKIFSFEYGSKEWKIASNLAHFTIRSAYYDILKKLANQLPDMHLEDLFRTALVARKKIRELETQKESDHQEIENQISNQNALVSSSEQLIGKICVDIIEKNHNLSLEISLLEKFISSFKNYETCSLGFPVIPEGYKKNSSTKYVEVIDSIRIVSKHWYGDFLPSDWLVSYNQVEKILIKHGSCYGAIRRSPESKADILRAYRDNVEEMGLTKMFPDFPRQ